MLLSDLLGMPVHDTAGHRIGHVVDMRLRRGDRQGVREAELEVVALIVSPRTRLSMYGYERGRLRRPAVIAALIRALHGRSRLVPWECVARVEADRVRLGVDPPMIPLDPARPVPEA